MAETINCSLSQHIDRLRPLIDAALDAATRLPDGCPQRLRDAIRYSLLAPGKRLRPLLVLMAAEACGGRAQAAMPAALAVEMIHAYSLIHDDLPAMDDDDLRRGRPTCHKRFDEATAILAGDALFALAMQTLAEAPLRPQVVVECCATLAATAGPCQLAGGQADDVAGGLADVANRLDDIDINDRSGDGVAERLQRLESIHDRKTGSLIAASLRLGALAAAADSLQLEAIQQYGRRLGLAFQITDDLLDVRGDQAALGKRVGKDADQGKLTFPGLLGAEESTARAERLILEACAALAPLGETGDPLAQLAQYVLQRTR